MRSRLLLVLAVLATLTVATFAVPLGASVAEARTREFVLTRDGDVQRFASLAENYVTGEGAGALFDEMEAYHELYGEDLAVISTRGVPARSLGVDLDSPEVSQAVSRALRNQSPTTQDALKPWSQDEAIFAKPVGTDAQVNGAVLLVASTGAAKADIVRAWLYILLGVAAALAAFGVLAHSVSNWVLRPLERLSGRVQQLTESLPFARRRRDEPEAPDPVLPRRGPPELRELTRSFESMSDDVHRSAEAQRRLVADTAHQLRNPLAALQLRLDTLEPAVSEIGRRSYERAAAESHRLAGILDDLLKLAAAESPGSRTDGPTARCLPLTVAADRVDFWQGSASELGIGLELQTATEELEDALEEVEAAVPATVLAQILDVLIDNACKYAAGASLIRVAVERRPAANGYTRIGVSVADNGPGVPAEARSRLTERFYRGSELADRQAAVQAGPRPPGDTGRNSAARAGTGLGLAIAAALAQSFAGVLEFSETEGGGLTATAVFPRFTPVESGQREVPDED
ncbi:sensor histidine kinase [Crystallibacter degradans]|uniref:sensor histidine kinase n=1 Tax=Crystallibacter degradans TaxID=2726743 RepID=UPI001472E0BD|nr:HAMP domain-containing sensor histidine kinase [Arthrobacter sp. SF27]NMR31621.1 HAMP domain-containing histidine kinase [Arthrobacter sp. SF27]